MERIILHCDLNNFYASVECMKRPEIRGLPVAVAGDVKSRSGIILAKNEIAKKFGVKTGEPIFEAKKKCKNLVCVPPNMKEYLKISKKVKDIYYDFTDMIEPFGIDEAWLDVTGSVNLFGSGEEIAYKIRKRVREEIGITISVGVSFNKIFAKLGSDMKKPDATTVITKENFKEKVWKLPMEDLLYIGRSTSKKLKSKRLKTIGDIANCDVKHLESWLGKWGNMLHIFANGLDNSPVEKFNYKRIVKSISNGITSPFDLVCENDIKIILCVLSESIATRLMQSGYSAKNIAIGIKSTDFKTYTRQRELIRPVFMANEIAEIAYEILMENWDKTPIRALSVRTSDLDFISKDEQTLILYPEEKRIKKEKIEKSVYNIRERYGFCAVRRARALENLKLSELVPHEEHTVFPRGFFS